MEDAPRGRPRDARIDEAVLRATRELLATEGYEATTILAVARRAGVGASAIYRRWPSRLELIATATSAGLEELEVEPADDLRTYLGRFVQAYLDQFDSPVHRAALPALLTAPSDGDEFRGVVHRVAQGIRPAFRAALASAPAGTVDPAVDPDVVLDVLIGAVLYRTIIHPFTGRAGAAEDIADLLFRAVRPDARGGSTSSTDEH